MPVAERHQGAKGTRHPRPAALQGPESAALWTHAVKWLESNSGGLSKDELHSYFSPLKVPPSSFEDLFREMLRSLTDAGMMKKVIVGAMPQRIDSLKDVTFGFSPERTYGHYLNDSRALLKDIKSRIGPTGKIRKRKKSLWPKYCKTILSTAKFLQQFAEVKDFYLWMDRMKGDSRLRVAIPLMLSEEVYGCGFALACNILIDLEYKEFGKPDRHVRRILEGAGFSMPKASDYEVLKVMFQICDETQIYPFALDKALYLIGSGDYFLHNKGEKKLTIPGKRLRTGKFLKYWKKAQR